MPAPPSLPPSSVRAWAATLTIYFRVRAPVSAAPPHDATRRGETADAVWAGCRIACADVVYHSALRAADPALLGGGRAGRRRAEVALGVMADDVATEGGRQPWGEWSKLESPLALLKAVDAEQGWGAWLAWGAAVGVGLMAKYTMAAFLPSALLLMLLEPAGRRWLRRPQPWLALLLALAIFSPNLYWNWIHHFPTFRHTAEITEVGHRGWHPGELGEFIGAQWLSLGPLMGILLAWALARSRRIGQDRAGRVLLIFILPLLTLVSLQALTGRANGNWAAPIFVAACLLVPAVFLTDRRRWVVAGVVVNLVASVAAYHWPDIARLTGSGLTAKNDPYKRARGWINLADGVAPFVAEHPGAILVGEDREIIAHLVYRLHPVEYAAWNPGRPPRDHYEIVTTLADKRGRDVLYVGRQPEIPAIAAHFAGSERLGKVVVPIHADFKRDVYVFLLKDFQGY